MADHPMTIGLSSLTRTRQAEPSPLRCSPTAPLHYGIAATVALTIATGLYLPDLTRLVPLEGKAYEPLLRQGLDIAATAWLAVGVLAGVGAFRASVGASCGALSAGPRIGERSIMRVTWPIVGGLALTAGLLRAISLRESFWWDELTTLLRCVRRGVPVILTFSADCNNHVLNSLSAWGAIRVLGEGEWQVRVPGFLLGTIVAPVAYAATVQFFGRPVALWAGIITALHSTLIVASSEARGYSGAILCAFVSMACFARMVDSSEWIDRSPTGAADSCRRQGKGIRWCTLTYVLANVVGSGFLVNFLLVPASHLATAAILRRRPFDGGGRPDAILAAMMAMALSVAIFGVQIPQVLAYAAGDHALREHLTLGSRLLIETGQYVTGVGGAGPAGVLLFVAAVGWRKGRTSPANRVAYLAPVALAGLWLLVPGQRYSARLFYMLIPPFVLGLALALSRGLGTSSARIADVGRSRRSHGRLEKNSFLGSVAVDPRRFRGSVAHEGRCYTPGENAQAAWLRRSLTVVTIAIWLMGAVPIYADHVTIGHPDLAGLSARLSGQKVALFGRQADVNTYYFPGAALMSGTRSETIRIPDQVRFIVAGTSERGDVDPRLLAAGFHQVEHLASWRCMTSYHVYARNDDARQDEYR